MISRVLFTIGSIGLVGCIYWWANYYTAFLEASGMKATTKDWTEGIQIYGQCLFWDTEQCLKAMHDPKLQDLSPYRPHFIWLAVGVLLGGAVSRIKETWDSAGSAPKPRT
jgi:hypothetical protein